MYTSCNAPSAPFFGKKISLYTLGCKLNFAETSAIGRQFTENGFEKVSFGQKSDVVLINTCSVTDNADKKCKHIVKSALKISPKAFIIIVGCYAQLKPEEISKIPGVNVVLGAKEKFDIFSLLKDFSNKAPVKIFSGDIKDVKKFVPSYSVGDRTRTFLKVQDGCNYKCSFCTIPFARGQSRSTSIDIVLEQIKEISKLDIKEIVLTGINLGDYGIIEGRRKTNFLELIKNIDDLECDVERYRISSIEPNLLSDEIIAFVSKSKKFVPHFHIPLQSGCDEILKKMRRRYFSQLYIERVHAIKEQMPDCCIGVDVIVGFPGEKEENFLQTKAFLENLEVSYLHVFPYSERDNTDAITYFSDLVPQKERIRRATILRSLSEKKLKTFYEKYLHTTKKVLFEKENIEGKMLGFTENYVRVVAPFNENLCNKIVNFTLKKINEKGIVEGDFVQET